jgi:hypothetical protein
MSGNALNMAQPGMWHAACKDAEDMWQVASRHMATLQVIDSQPALAALLDEAMMALADGVTPGPFTAAADVLRGARARTAEQRQQPEPPRHGTGPQYTPNGHDAPKAVAQ